MVIQVIKRREEDRGPSQAQRNEYMVDRVFDFAQGAQNFYQQQSKEKQIKKEQLAAKERENEYFKKLYGEDVSELSPKEREIWFTNKLKTEGKKQEFSQRLQTLRDSGLDQYIGNVQEPQSPNFKDEIMGGKKPSQYQDKVNESGVIELGNIDVPSLIPEQAIYKAELIGEHNLAQQMKEHNKEVNTQNRHNEELQFKRDRESPESKRESALAAQQAKADMDYNTQLQQSSSLTHIKTKTLTDLEKLNEKGVTGKPYEKLLEKFGLVNLTSEGRREFAADVKHMITDIRSILGGQFSNFEFQTILNAYPSADFSQGANRAIINNLKEFQDIKNKEIEFANQIKKNNDGKIPKDFQSLVNQKLNEYVEDRLPSIKANTRKVMHEEYGIPEGNYLMFDNNGEPLSVPEEMLEHYMELGATLP